MRIDPSVILCMLSRALRSLPLVSERSLPLLPTCTLIFFFQAEDGIRDAQESRGLGDVYKRQVFSCSHNKGCLQNDNGGFLHIARTSPAQFKSAQAVP